MSELLSKNQNLIVQKFGDLTLKLFTIYVTLWEAVFFPSFCKRVSQKKTKILSLK